MTEVVLPGMDGLALASRARDVTPGLPVLYTVEENKLSAAQIIDVKIIPPNGKVVFGVTVTLLNLDNEEESIYQIVGDDEADIKVNKISVYSPVARALVGKALDDVVVVKTPNGDVEYEICSIEHL